MVYVDDIIITGNDLKEIQGLESHLDQNFQVKRLGSLKYFCQIDEQRGGKEKEIVQPRGGA